MPANMQITALITFAVIFLNSALIDLILFLVFYFIISIL